MKLPFLLCLLIFSARYNSLAQPPNVIKAGTVVMQLDNHNRVVLSAYSKTAGVLATVESNIQRIIFWDIHSKLKITTFSTKGDIINLVVDPYGSRFAACTNQGLIYIINAKTLDVIKTVDCGLDILGDSQSRVVFQNFPLAFRDSSNLIFSSITRIQNNGIGGYIANYYIDQEQTDTLIKCGDDQHVIGVFLCSNGKTLAFVTDSSFAKLEIESKGRIQQTPLAEKLSYLESTGFIWDEEHNRLGCLTPDGNLAIFNTSNGKITKNVDSVMSIVGLTAGKWLYQSYSKKKMYQFDCLNGVSTPIYYQEKDPSYFDNMIRISNTRFALLNSSGINILDTGDNKILNATNRSVVIFGICTTKDGNLVYGTGSDLYEFNYYKLSVNRLVYHGNMPIYETQYAPHKDILIIHTENAQYKHQLIAVQYSTGKILWQKDWNQVQHIAISPGEEKLSILNNFMNYSELSLESGTLIRVVKSTDMVYNIKYSENSNALLGLTMGSLASNDFTKVFKVVQFSNSDSSPNTFFNIAESSTGPLRTFSVSHDFKNVAISFPEDDKFYIIPIEHPEIHYMFNNASAIEFSPHDKYLVSGSFSGGRIVIRDYPNLQTLSDISGGVGQVYDLHFSANDNILFANMEDGWVSMIDIRSGKEIAKLIFDGDKFIAFNNYGYYAANKSEINEIGYRSSVACYPITDLDIKFNRPDILMAQMGQQDTSLISIYRKAYEKRINRLNITLAKVDMRETFTKTTITNSTSFKSTTTDSLLSIPLKVTGNGHEFNRINLWVNNVPVYGSNGLKISIHEKLDTTITLNLSVGQNIVEAAAIDVDGFAGLRDKIELTYTPKVPSLISNRVFFVGIGIDLFANSAYDLQYCVKGIHDLEAKFKEKYKQNCFSYTLVNKEIDSASIGALKRKLEQTGVNDKVIVVYSGHGVFGKINDYYLSTYNMNFNDPKIGGISYAELESLVDNIPSRKKLLLIDACNSGEKDTAATSRYNLVSELFKNTDIKAKLSGPPENINSTLSLDNSFELMNELFVNISKNTGSTIICAASGFQFAYEKNDLKNGVFIFSILENMDKNMHMKLSDLKNNVYSRVKQLTHGLQAPAVRNETNIVDWDVW